MYSVDLNSDMGESFGAYKLGGDAEIIQYVTTANVACGWHAGDPMVMDKVVSMAKERGVMVGAHPGYPDLMGFGRRKMALSYQEVKNYVKYQIGALAALRAAEDNASPQTDRGNQPDPADDYTDPAVLLRRFQQERWHGIRPALWGGALREAELTRSIYGATLNIDGGDCE